MQKKRLEHQDTSDQLAAHPGIAYVVETYEEWVGLLFNADRQHRRRSIDQAHAENLARGNSPLDASWAAAIATDEVEVESLTAEANARRQMARALADRGRR